MEHRRDNDKFDIVLEAEAVLAAYSRRSSEELNVCGQKKNRLRLFVGVMLGLAFAGFVSWWLIQFMQVA